MTRHPSAYPGRGQRGYSMIEILIALLIALFLLAGLGTLVAGTRRTSSNQTALAQLQDEERLAMSMLNDIVQTAGYFDSNPNDTTFYTSAATAFPTSFTTSGGPSNPTLTAGQIIGGSHSSAATPDTLVVRYATSGSDGIIDCVGGSSTAAVTYENYFFIAAVTNPATGTTTYQLQCSADGNAGDAVTLISNVANMQVYYGVSTVNGSSNPDTYMTADQVTNLGDWGKVMSVRVTLTFVNPLYNSAQSAQTPQYVFLTRVISLQSRVGPVETAS